MAQRDFDGVDMEWYVVCAFQLGSVQFQSTDARPGPDIWTTARFPIILAIIAILYQLAVLLLGGEFDLEAPLR
jgi:hypothetical protein